MKLIVVIILTFIGICAHAQNVPVQFRVNGENVSGVHYYLVTKTTCKELEVDDDKLTIPDNVTYPYYVLLIYKSHQIILPVPYSDITYLDLYYDTRKHDNEVVSKFDESPKRDSWFFRRYIVDYGNGMMTTTYSRNIDYIKKYSIKIYGKD